MPEPPKTLLQLTEEIRLAVAAGEHMRAGGLYTEFRSRRNLLCGLLETLKGPNDEPVGEVLAFLLYRAEPVD